MSTGPENERSMLEAKELDQLQAIAKTLSVKANSRTKKADLVTRILEATGVSEGASPKPEVAPKAEAAPQPSQKPAERENRAPEGSVEQAPPREGGAPRGERTQQRRRKTVASFTFGSM
ncbi:MAG: Rho termination factor N-terminal domain-containing protein, partial [Actinomycetes bacterium]